MAEVLFGVVQEDELGAGGFDGVVVFYTVVASQKWVLVSTG